MYLVKKLVAYPYPLFCRVYLGLDATGVRFLTLQRGNRMITQYEREKRYDEIESEAESTPAKEVTPTGKPEAALSRG